MFSLGTVKVGVFRLLELGILGLRFCSAVQKLFPDQTHYKNSLPLG